jgi:diadenosine tetraphosphate (Ap4A) HIT family hydrolase
VSGGRWKGVTWHRSEGKDDAYQLSDCVFCDIVQQKLKRKLLFQDDRVTIFYPLAQAAFVHILVIPNLHHGPVNTRQLSLHDRFKSAHPEITVDLLQHMQMTGNGVLRDILSGKQLSFEQIKLKQQAESQQVEEKDYESIHSDGVALIPDDQLEQRLATARFVFHKAPFNTIDHLHLHCMIPPYSSAYDSFHFKQGQCWSGEWKDQIGIRNNAANP